MERSMTLDNETTIDLESLNARLDYLVARHEMLEDLIREMTPVVREAMKVGTERLAAWEERGVFTLLAELADRVVPLLETVRNLTEPDVLAVANEAGEVIHHAVDYRPVGMMGAMRATRDKDIQHGMALALEVLRHLGRERNPSNLPVPTHAPAVSHAPAPAAPDDPSQRVVWEGVTFTAEGFLAEPNEWSEALAEKMAGAVGIALTEDHWTVLRWIRQDWSTTGASPNVRRTSVGSGIGTQALYQLFPRTPGKTAAMLAGVPKPVGCV
jgi:TusE/DsrC/DsvC family sulfur relay protein